jgi:thioredoxin
MLDIACPSCGETYHVAEAHLGRSLRCRRCDRVFEIAVPRVASEPSSPPPAHQAREPHKGPVAVTDLTFEQAVLASPLPVVVDFWAPWCAPCRAIAPAVEQLADEYAGRVVFAKLNTDDNPRIMSRHGVMGLPTLVLFKGGREAGRLVGLQSKAAIKRAVDQIAGS